MRDGQINKDPIAFLIDHGNGAESLCFAKVISTASAISGGWKPLYDHLEDGETEALRIANAVIAAWQKRYRTLELAALDGDRMIDDLRGRSEVLFAALLAPLYQPSPDDPMSTSNCWEWFRWNGECRPINKNYVCDVVLRDGRVLLGQSPYDFDWSEGGQVVAAKYSEVQKP